MLRNTTGRSARRVRPQFEALEDRLLMDHALAHLCGHDHHDEEHAHAFYDVGYSGDHADEYALESQKWSHQTISYSYSNLFNGSMAGLTNAQMRSAIEEVLGRWASYAPLHFVEVADSGSAVTGSDASYSATNHPLMRIGHHYIDGNSGTLAHAYYPGDGGLSGDLHFDNGESWTVGRFMETALHEIGHALGLKHEDRVDAIMNSTVKNRFSGLGTSYLLQDDVNGIVAMYGSGAGSVTPWYQAKPGTATIHSPASTTTDRTPTISWSLAGGATWYRLYVEHVSTGQVVFDQWLNGATSATPNSNLAAGSYRAWVQTWGNNVYGDWSAARSFTIQAVKPGTATLHGPFGATTDRTPTISWGTAAGATWYQLYVQNLSTGQVVFDEWLQGATSATPNSNLAVGGYRYWVRTWGNDEYGDWSKPGEFTIQALKPGLATLLGPSGVTNDRTPTLSWTTAKGATWYHLYVLNVTTGKVVFDQWLEGATTATPNSDLATGSYRLWVRTWGNDEYGDWTDEMRFEIR